MKIEFVSYDGAYPNLCSGVFTVRLDGRETSFGAEYPRFWTSGGGVSFDDEWNECVSRGPWELSFDERDYPPEIAAAMPGLIDAFNENVPWGCCGGCV